MSALKEGVLALLVLLVLVLACLSSWDVVDIKPLGVVIALQVSAFAWGIVVIVGWIRGE